MKALRGLLLAGAARRGVRRSRGLAIHRPRMTPAARPRPRPGPRPRPAAHPAELVLLTHDAFALTDTVIQGFERDHNTTLKVLKAGDAGAMVNQAILSKDHPLGDVLFGVDNTFLVARAGRRHLRRRTSRRRWPGARRLPARSAEPGHPGRLRRRLPELDKACVRGRQAARTDGPRRTSPTPAYASMLVVENPATSSPGLAFMLATIARFGERALRLAGLLEATCAPTT